MLRAFAWENGKLVCVEPERCGNATWFDLENGVPEEMRLRHPPHRPGPARLFRLTEIETSSRLATDGPVLTMSMPIVTRGAEGLHAGVCGFVLSPEALVTLRFTSSAGVPQFANQPHAIAGPGRPSFSSRCWKPSSTAKPTRWKTCGPNWINCRIRFFITAWRARRGRPSWNYRQC